MPDHPLRPLEANANAEFMPYGPPLDDTGKRVEVVQSFGHYEAEYAAMRKGAGLFHMPQRGLLEVTGKDRADFLHRMVTNDINALAAGRGCRAFLLNNKGRIVADMIVLQEADRTLIDLDIFQADEVRTTLSKFVFADDVKLRDVSADYVHLSLQGPAGATLIAQAGSADVSALEPIAHQAVDLQGTSCTVFRYDDAGVVGLHLLLPRAQADAIHESLATLVGGLVPDVEAAGDGAGAKRPIVGRGIGWLAYNTVRIEGGRPIFHVDFGVDCLPHESGVLREAVSFTKGCYLGQEIVARMESLGHPKRVLAWLTMADDRMPIAGGQVFDAQAETQTAVVGAVTSSTLAPMRGGTALAIAMLKWGKHEAGTLVKVSAEGELADATVASLRA